MKNRARALLFVAAAVVLFMTVRPNPGPAAASLVDLQGAFGGACQDCMYDPGGPCVGTTCVPLEADAWSKIVGTLVTPIWCFDVGAGEAGATSCSDTLPMPCKTESVCSDAACNNCGPAIDTDPRDTKCTLGSTLCRGPGS